MMPDINNGESAASVRSKMNNAIRRTEFAVVVKDVSQLANLVYTTGSQWTVAAGDNVTTAKEGFHYTVLASGASSFDLQPGAVKLDVLPVAAGYYNFDSMLPAGDGVTNDYAKLKRLLDKITFDAGALYQASPTIYFPPKNYFIGQTLELKQTVHLLGTGGKYPNPVGSALIFPANTTGIVINRFNTNEAGETTSGTGADWTTIEGLQIIGQGGTGRSKPGILMRARGAIVGSYVAGFAGNGISIIAGAGVGGAAEGNANLWLIQNTKLTQNQGWGLYVDGADTNAGNGIGVDCTNNGRGGIWDSSFLGNTYYGCHTATNGVATVGGNTSTQSSFVSFGGNRYAAHWNATEAQLVATEPGTNNDIWRLDGAGGIHPTIPLWQAGQPEGTYFVAFSYYSEGDSSRNLFINCYSEGGAAGSVVLSSSGFLFGLLHRVYAGGALSCSGGGTNWGAQTLQSNNGDLSVATTDGTAYLTLRGIGTNEVWRLKRQSDGTLRFDNANSGTRVPFEITGPSAGNPYQFSVPTFLLGGKRMMMGTAAPTTGTYAVGDRVLNSAPAVGQPKGWICTVAGTPGTWVSEGNL